MSDMQKHDHTPAGTEDEATDSRTLDEIEQEEKVPANPNRSTIPSPDEGSGRNQDDDAGGPM
jgi:hypothetical protein